MRKKLLACLLWSVCIGNVVFAQNYNDYKALKNAGNLPEDFTRSSTEKYKSEADKLKLSEERKKDKRAKDEFYLKTTFAIDGLVRSGIVLMDEDYSAYLREILHLLLKDEPALEKRIRIYAVRSHAVNAVALANGIILVNLGLIAQLENEAQLAFVISHEIAHIEKEHSLELFMQSVKVKRTENRQEVFGANGVDAKQFRRHLHSRENENEADDIGFKRFANTSYKLSNVNKVFDILKYAHLPFDEVKFEKDFLQVQGVEIPESYLKNDIPAIKGQDENDDDTDKTHPNLAKRRENLASFVSKVGKDIAQGDDYLLSQTKFERLQKIARFELPMLTLHNHLYALTLYNAFLLSKIEKESIYIEKIRLKALYGYTKHKTDENGNLISEVREVEEYSINEGESSQVPNILYKKMFDNELCLLSMLHAIQLHKKYPQDIEIEKMYRDLLWQLTSYYDLSALEKMATDVPRVVEKKIEQDSTQNKPKTKLDKIKARESVSDDEESKKKEKVNFQKALAELLKDSEFKELFKNFKENRDKKEENDAKYEREQAKIWKKRLKKGASLGLDKVVVVTPHYVLVNPISTTSTINFVGSEAGAKEVRACIEESATKIKLDIVMLDKTEFQATDTEKFNETVLLNDWFREQNDAGRMAIWGYQQNEIEAIATKYGTDNFLWFGLVASENTNETMFMAILFNVRTGRNEIVKNLFMRKKGSDWLIKMHIYDTLNQIKTKPKK